MKMLKSDQNTSNLLCFNFLLSKNRSETEKLSENWRKTSVGDRQVDFLTTFPVSLAQLSRSPFHFANLNKVGAGVRQASAG